MAKIDFLIAREGDSPFNFSNQKSYKLSELNREDLYRLSEELDIALNHVPDPKINLFYDSTFLFARPDRKNDDVFLDDKGEKFWPGHHFVEMYQDELLELRSQVDEEIKRVALDSIRNAPFMNRTGAEQELLRNYWFEHKDIDIPLNEYMGMSLDQYEDWKNGTLKLNDGSYHEMEDSFFHIPTSVVDTIRSEIVSKEMLERNLLFSAFLYNLLPNNPCSGYLSSTCDWAMIYDPGDDLVAIVSMDDIMYKEDFASMMKTSGIEATESNFEKVWDVFAANKNPKKSLRDNAYAAVQSVNDNLLKKPSLSEQIHSASTRAAESMPTSPAKIKEHEPEI